MSALGVPEYEARTMVHPLHKKGVAHPITGKDPVSGKAFTDYQGEPDVFPDVVVKDPTTEAQFRARGYLFAGEAPAPPAEYAEFPVMLSHPHHVPAIADDWDISKGASGEMIRSRIPGKPEMYPPRMAKNEAEERYWSEKGYRRIGNDNPEAIRTAKAAPYDPDRVTHEYPKIVNGLTVDPNADMGGPQEYPKYIGDVLVHSRAQEIALAGKVTERPTEMCIICGDPITADDEMGEGVAGKFHAAHMAPKPVQSEGANTALAALGSTLTSDVPASPEVAPMTHADKIRAGRAKAKAEREAAAAKAAETQE